MGESVAKLIAIFVFVTLFMAATIGLVKHIVFGILERFGIDPLSGFLILLIISAMGLVLLGKSIVELITR